MSESAERAALERVPDLPKWVDTRGMLLTGHATVTFADTADVATDGFVVSLPSRALASVVGAPPPGQIAASAKAMAGDVNVLCPPDCSGQVAEALPGWRQHAVIIHALPGLHAWEGTPDPDVAIFNRDHPPVLDHVPEPLCTELREALEGRPTARFVPGALPALSPSERSDTPIPIAGASADGRLVAFCYPVLQTETLWDVSVDTLPGYRGRGLAGRAAGAMIAHMRLRGKAPVWGALASNAASLRLARRLGFVEAGRLVVFTAR